MTIAAGLLCKEGVLLCADTEEVSWATKSHASKLTEFAFPGGHVAFAYAGNTRFASSAVQKCKRHLNKPRKEDPKNPFDPLLEIEQTLDKEYRRNVLTHPNQASDGDLHYWLLMGLSLEGEPARLYITEKTAIDEVRTFACIGVGEPLAHHLIKPNHHREMGYSEALVTAANALAIVKDQVRDCDGMSVFYLLRNDGVLGMTSSSHAGACSDLETYAAAYDFLSKRMLLYLFDPTKDEAYFEANLESLYTAKVREIFKEVSSARQRRHGVLQKLNPNLTFDQVRLLDLTSTIGNPPLPQPSPESP